MSLTEASGAGRVSDPTFSESWVLVSANSGDRVGEMGNREGPYLDRSGSGLQFRLESAGFGCPSKFRFGFGPAPCGTDLLVDLAQPS